MKTSLIQRKDLLVAACVTVAAVTIPFLVDARYVITQATVLFIWATVVVQWNLVFGIAGIFSLAQMALFAVGAYATAMIGFYLDWSIWLAMPIAAVAAVIVSMLIGLACLQLRGAYVALLTLAISQVFYVLIVTDTHCFTTASGGCMPLMGGVRGITSFGDLGLRQTFKGDWHIASYFLGFVLLAVATAFSLVIVRGPLGLAFKALRDNPGYAASRGISRFKYQLWIFACSAFFTGLAGAFYAAHFRVIGPSVLSITLLLFLLAMIVVGGVGTIWGPLLGALFLMLGDEFAKEFSGYRDVGLGLLLILFVMFLPRGIVGAWNDWRQRRRNAADGTG